MLITEEVSLAYGHNVGSEIGAGVIVNAEARPRCAGAGQLPSQRHQVLALEYAKLTHLTASWPPALHDNRDSSPTATAPAPAPAQCPCPLTRQRHAGLIMTSKVPSRDRVNEHGMYCAGRPGS